MWRLFVFGGFAEKNLIDSQIHFSGNLRIYRKNTGHIQAELGKKLENIPRQNISSMEKGKIFWDGDDLVIY